MFTWDGKYKPKELLEFKPPFIIKVSDGVYGKTDETSLNQGEIFLVFKKQKFKILQLQTAKTELTLSADSKCNISELPLNPNHVYETVNDLLKRVPRYVIIGKKFKILEKVGSLRNNDKGEKCLTFSRYEKENQKDGSKESFFLPLKLKAKFKEFISDEPCTIQELFQSNIDLPLPRTVQIVGENPIRLHTGANGIFTIINIIELDESLLCYQIPNHGQHKVVILPTTESDDNGEIPLLQMGLKDEKNRNSSKVLEELNNKLNKILNIFTYSDPEIHNGPRSYSFKDVTGLLDENLLPTITESEDGQNWVIDITPDMGESSYYLSMEKPDDPPEYENVQYGSPSTEGKIISDANVDTYKYFHQDNDSSDANQTGVDEYVYIRSSSPENDEAIYQVIDYEDQLARSGTEKPSPPKLDTKVMSKPPVIAPKPKVIVRALPNLPNDRSLPQPRKSVKLSRTKSIEEYPDDLSSLAVKDLADLLRLYKLSRTADIIEDETIDGKLFVTLTEENFKTEPFNAKSFEAKKLARLTEGKIQV